MRARTISALWVVLGVLMVGAAGLLSGCVAGHKQFAYTVGAGTNEIFSFKALRDGTLTPLATPNFAAGSNPTALAVHTNGNFLYIADFAGNNLLLLDINRGNGLLSTPASTSIVVPVTPPNVFNTGAGPIAVAMSPTAPFLYSANQTEGDITGFTVNPGDGTLSFIQNFPLAAGAHPQSLVISPKGDFLFVANPGQATVEVFAISSKGLLAEVAGSPFAMGAGATPNALAVAPSGRFLYVADSAHNAILGFAVQANGAISAISGSPFAAGVLPGALAVDPQGALLYAANTGSNSISAYVIDSASGALGAVNGSPFATGGTGPSALTVDSTTTVLYVSEQASHDIATFGILANGTLKPVTGSPFSVATSAQAIALVRP